MTDNFPVEQLVTQSSEMKKLYFISPQMSDFLYSDVNSHQLNIINMGVVLFNRNQSKYNNIECIFRIDQDGVLNLIPYMTKRLIWTTKEESFKQVLMNKTLEVKDIADPEMKQQIDLLSNGCFILSLRHKGSQNEEAIVMHKFTTSMNMMMSRESVFSLHIRYLTETERKKCAGEFDLPK